MSGFVVNVLGQRFGVRVNTRYALELAKKVACEEGWDLDYSEEPVTIIYSLRVAESTEKRGRRNFHLLYLGAGQASRTLDLGEFLEGFRRSIWTLAAPKIFQACDGETEFRELPRRLGRKDGEVEASLSLLTKRDLISPPTPGHISTTTNERHMTRRDLLGGLAKIAALPLIVTISLSTPVNAGSSLEAFAALACNDLSINNFKNINRVLDEHFDEFLDIYDQIVCRTRVEDEWIPYSYIGYAIYGGSVRMKLLRKIETIYDQNPALQKKIRTTIFENHREDLTRAVRNGRLRPGAKTTDLAFYNYLEHQWLGKFLTPD